jgi:hypothetical protein
MIMKMATIAAYGRSFGGADSEAEDVIIFPLV